MIASSDSSGVVNIWDIRNKNCFSNQHLFKKSAIKALEWCPWKNGILAAGGGSKDPRIIVWNHNEREIIQKFKAKSQVTRLLWKQQTRELVTTHGSGLGVVWNVQNGLKKESLIGHQERILGLVEANKGIWTLGADDTMRFWEDRHEKQKERMIQKSENLEIK